MALIKTYNSVPSVYTHQSRDFQLIGHVYEAVFNSSKLATDMLNKMMPNADFDERLLNLSTTTTGFIRKHEYNTMDLTMILNSFAHLLRLKGTKLAIESALNILLRSQGISDPYSVEVDANSKLLTLYLSERLEDVVLLTDLFDYILPFGFNYRIIQSKVTSAAGYPTEIEYQDVQSGDVKIGVAEIENAGIVSDTFKTTIDHNLPESVSPRPIKDGQVIEVGTVFEMVDKLPDQVSGLYSYRYVSSYWAKQPVVGSSYSVEVSLTVYLGSTPYTEEKTFTWTPASASTLYEWSTTLHFDEIDEDVNLQCENSPDGVRIVGDSAGIPQNNSTLSVSIVDLV